VDIAAKGDEALKESASQRSLEESLIRIRSRVGSCLNHVELLTAAAPFCAPVLELARDDLREALAAAQDAERLERKLVRILAGPAPLSSSTTPRPEETDSE
jgi:hypothetical protein